MRSCANELRLHPGIGGRQNLGNQLAELKATDRDPIFREKITGVHADRPQLKTAFAQGGA
jgi:hypothetical protein